MKKFILVISFFGLLFGENKYRFYLENDKNLRASGENYKTLKFELDKMIEDYNSKIDLNNYWHTKIIDRVVIGQKRDQDAINSALEQDRVLMSTMNIYEKKAHMDLIESFGSITHYKNVEKKRNKIIDKNVDWANWDPNKLVKRLEVIKAKIADIKIETELMELTMASTKYFPGYETKIQDNNIWLRNLIKEFNLYKKRFELLDKKSKLGNQYFGRTFTVKEIKWNDIISQYGGYAELSKIGISKSNISQFNLNVTFDKIELTGPNTCLAYIKIEGDDKVLSFHNIPKRDYKYEGTYEIKYDNDYLTLLEGGNIWMKINFTNQKYLNAFEEIIILDNSILPNVENYRNNITSMIDDLISENEKNSYTQISYEKLKESCCSKYQLLLNENFKGKVKKYKKAKLKELKYKKKFSKFYRLHYGISTEHMEPYWKLSLSKLKGENKDNSKLIPPNGFDILYLIQSCGFDPADKCE